ncbi:hypothetical protein C463_05115 [Halorubrum californiense DSM 19288]|uniref:DUF4382 domain-containing protein n=1 Tax=Halorubrum californiense DSM 19288 TaxID=1227465 RepID=M0EH95_9EURY|nr:MULTISPECIES: DUF4382 domain-containing protein [Halorubrum]ELZ45789.1 hypothetical protein C463_05115 [Halorubrum californiense DSM 19288]TKX66163.1 DUF4382 domain-containing protein [Halorubrum sp. GN11GM_10-3_MGM]
MTNRSRTTDDDGSRLTDGGLGRRKFVALGAGASATLLAGCAGEGSLPSSDESDGPDGSDGSNGSQTLTGSFRLLISDAPADIGDFDRLDVTLDRARVFEAENGEGAEEDEETEDEEDDEEESDDDTEENATETGDDTGENVTETDGDDGSPNGTADDEDEEDDVGGDESEDNEGDTEEDDGEEDDGEDGEEDRGFTVVELDGATVDLTQVIDEDAVAVFDGEIPAGSYEKIELEVSAIEGIVDGSEVDVKLPSEKLQITNGFEVAPDEEVSFVFDINVVKRGKNNGYILKPVISGSGVAGRDVDVNEIDDDDDEGEESGDDDSEADGDDSDGEDDEDDGEATDDKEATDDDSEGDDATGGNETSDAENETESGS